MGWLGWMYVSLTPPTTRAPLAVLISYISATSYISVLHMFLFSLQKLQKQPQVGPTQTRYRLVLGHLFQIQQHLLPCQWVSAVSDSFRFGRQLLAIASTELASLFQKSKAMFCGYIQNKVLMTIMIVEMIIMIILMIMMTKITKNIQIL